MRSAHPRLIAAALALVLSAPALPGAAAAQSFGAIAYSPATGQWGWARNFTTRAGAQNRALAECRSAARGRSCQVAVWFRNACGSLAIGPNGWGSGWGNTRARAQAEARGACNRYSRNCAIRLTTCSR